MFNLKKKKIYRSKDENMPENKNQVSVQELLITVNVTQDAIIDLLEEKGLITKAEIMQKKTLIRTNLIFQNT